MVRRRSCASDSDGHEHHCDRRNDHAGQAGVPAATGNRAEIQEAQHLLRIDHLRDVQPRSEQQAADGGDGEVGQASRASHAATPVTATVTMATEKKIPTATKLRSDRRAMPHTP